MEGLSWTKELKEAIQVAFDISHDDATPILCAVFPPPACLLALIWADESVPR